MYELFEHTADMGLRARAEKRNELFSEMARALFSVLVVDTAAVRPLEGVAFRLQETELDCLLHDWLSELLYLFETKHFVFTEFDVHINESGLDATVRGEPIDDHRHQFNMEVKAITYHGLRVIEEKNAWLAEVIIDL